jgi:CBS domain-containing protein
MTTEPPSRAAPPAPQATTLHAVARKPPAAVSGDTPLSQALALMNGRRIGALVVVDAAGAALGILTRGDVLERVTMPQLSLDTPVSKVMSAPVRTLDAGASAQDAVLMMSRHAIRHLPVTERGRVVGIVSERDLLTLQRPSTERLSDTIHAAHSVDELRTVAHEIRRFAGELLAQGVGAHQLTKLISHLNDVLTERLVQLIADAHRLSLQRACWLSFGSEGRSEQTIATDQDNGLVFDSEAPARDRAAWLAFAGDVNEALDACGYPLCKGNVMASNPQCCLTSAEWCARFLGWIEHGAPQDLLNASIYFDVRPLAGRTELAQPMLDLVFSRPAQVPRFIKQMAENALFRRPPLNWLGVIDSQEVDGRAMVNLKLQGTAIFVDAARLYALAHGVAQTSTLRRFEAVGPMLHAEPHESEGWIAAFEFLQKLRLQVQVMSNPSGGAVAADHLNLAEVPALNDIDRRVLKESFRVARRLQQRMELDYQR